MSQAFKSIEVLGDGGAGSIKTINFPDGGNFKSIKYRVDELNEDTYTYKYTLIEGDGLVENLEKITYDVKFEQSADGGSISKIFAVILPCTVFLIYYHYRRDVYDLHHAILGIMYSVLVTAVITDSIKDAVGRPRPNFFYRCFSDGIEAFEPNGNVNCHGDPKVVKEGYKSFPSGHTSWSFAGLAFLSWYLCGKVKAFDRRGHAAKLCIVLLPLLFAALVGISRIDDYWHHWTDVFTGSIIGSVVASLCYQLFFPFPHDINGWAPHASIKMRENIQFQSTSIGMDTV